MSKRISVSTDSIEFTHNGMATYHAYLDSNIALKRRQTAGLIPFPRVGRNNGEKFWSNQYFGQTKRREGLIPFPRVGKRTDEKSEDVSVMWFSPKSGRDFQRPILDLEEQYIISLLRDYQQLAESKKDDKKLSFSPEDYVKRKNSVGYPSFK